MPTMKSATAQPNATPAEVAIDTRGLTAAEAAHRLEKFGPNALPAKDHATWQGILARQFQSILVAILLVAAVIALALGELVDAVAVLAIIVLNGLLGFIQEWKAERSLDALAAMLRPTAEVVRDGVQVSVDATQIVPGDLVVLETGATVPADLELTEAVNLAADESALTGESEPVSKNPSDPKRSKSWMGTTVVRGHGRGRIIATGTSTEFGQVATMTATVDTLDTPLKRQLNRLAKQIGAIAVALAALVIGFGLVTGRPATETFFLGISLAVALVPEGLPAAVTITLALGIRAMARQRALLRRLQAAESLGAATIICTDKTGTLTQNRMVVTEIVTAAGHITVTGAGYTPEGQFFSHEGENVDPLAHPEPAQLLNVAAICNRAELPKVDGEWVANGEPTEAALIALVRKADLSPSEPLRHEIPFTSDRKRMSVIVDRQQPRVLTKGAPDVILDRCTTVQHGHTTAPLDAEARRHWEHKINELGTQGMRTLAFAERSLDDFEDVEDEHVEQQLTFLGIVGLLDPPRSEVALAVEESKQAGLKVVMVTGDAAVTARAIADRIGLDGRSAITGADIAAMDDDTLRRHVDAGDVLARTKPADKLRLVQVLQEAGHVVAMTGDGVNDGPALKRADIGVAMGIRGTDVARAASDIVLTDDNFQSIVGAVAEGRRQFDNIRKFVLYLLSSNAGELVAIVGCVLLGWPLILLPVQILWMNLVTDGVSAMALGVERADPDNMRRPPRDPKRPILDPGGLSIIAAAGVYMGIATLVLFRQTLDATGNLVLAQTTAFTALVIIEKANVFNFRSLRWPLTSKGVFSNPWLVAAVASTVVLQLAAVYVAPLQNLLHTTAIPIATWGKILLFAIPVIAVPELLKVFTSRARSAAGRSTENVNQRE